MAPSGSPAHSSHLHIEVELKEDAPRHLRAIRDLVLRAAETCAPGGDITTGGGHEPAGTLPDGAQEDLP